VLRPWSPFCHVFLLHHSRNDLVASFTSDLCRGGKTAAARAVKLVPVEDRYKRAKPANKSKRSPTPGRRPGVARQRPAKATGKNTRPASRQARADKAALAAMNNANPDQQMEPGGLFLLPSMIMSATPSGVYRSPSGAIAVLHAEAATRAEVSAFQAAGDKDRHLATTKPATHAAAHAVMLATGASSLWVALASSGRPEDVAVACIDHDPAATEATIRAASAAKWIVDAVEGWSPTRKPATLNGEQWSRHVPIEVAKRQFPNIALSRCLSVRCNKVVVLNALC
jgi:hypothetical protein